MKENEETSCIPSSRKERTLITTTKPTGVGVYYYPTSSERECEKSTESENSKEAVEWDSDINTSTVFQTLATNMVSVSHKEPNDTWAHHMDLQQDIKFEQRELPTEGKVTQINMGIEENSKSIFICESLTLEEKENLVALIREYIDVFA